MQLNDIQDEPGVYHSALSFYKAFTTLRLFPATAFLSQPGPGSRIASRIAKHLKIV
jgi:hypothetical protein